jgi:hypothetical protein
MALSPEEQRELDALESEFSAEEEAELAQLEAEFSEPASEFAPGQTHMIDPETKRTIEVPKEQQVPGEILAQESVIAGGIEGLPFAKDALAATESIVEIATTEAELSEFGERYANNKKEWDDEINRAEEANPNAFLAGDIGSSFAIPGGVFKSAGKLALGKTLAKSAMFGGASGVSRSEDRNASDFIDGAAAGAVGAGIGEGIGKAAGAVGKFFSRQAKKGIVEATGAMDMKTKKSLNNHVTKFFGKDTTKTVAQQTDEFATELLEETLDGKPLLAPLQSFEDTAEKAFRKKDLYGKEIGNILNQADEQVGKLKPELIYNDIKANSGISELLNSRDAKSQQLGNRLLKELDEAFGVVRETTPVVRKVSNPQTGALEEIPEMLPTGKVSFRDMSLLDLHKYKLDLAKRGRRELRNPNSTTNAEELNKRMGIISSSIENIVEGSSIDVKLADNFKSLNRKFANMNVVEEMASSQAMKAQQGPVGAIKDLFSGRGMTTGVLAAASGVPKEVSATIAIGVNQMLTSDSLPATLAKGMHTIGKHLSTNPDSVYLKRLITQASVGDEDFRKAMGNVVGELNLIDNAVARNVDDVKLKSDDLLPAIEFYDEDLANNLREAIKDDNDEAIAQIMDQVSKIPNSKKFIQDGVGFNGKVYSPEDKQMLIDQVDSMDISLHQKLMHKKGLRDQGTVPQIQQEQQTTDQFLQRRDKNKPKY